MANYAIGDIQGCYEAFRCLLKKIDFSPEQDKLWLAGDLVNRGPDSLLTLRYVYQLNQQKACETVLGNHDLHMLAVSHGCLEPKRKDNFHNVLEAEDCEVLLNWLQRQKLAINIEVAGKTFFLSHAGLPPVWSTSEALEYASEVELVLQGTSAKTFFEHMYGNSPDTWNETLTGKERLRLITNYFTRMRFCNEQGQLELLTKNEAHNAPKGFQPWFTLPNKKLNNEKLLFGHWAALQGETNSNQHLALDTGCVWGGELSAFRLEDERHFSCDC
jgi:bis(5'-nucleosyl)-tetraphosphatase (symmetrical)